MDIVSLIMRWLHIVGAATMLGGTIFMRFALVPSASELPDDAHNQLKKAIVERWKKFVMLASGLLLLSGFVNFGLSVAQYKLPPMYHILFGVKFLLALPIFLIAALLTGRTALADKIRANAKFWLTLNLVLAMVVVLVGGVMRHESYSRIPKSMKDRPSKASGTLEKDPAE